jgi:hypothetical protein
VWYWFLLSAPFFAGNTTHNLQVFSAFFIITTILLTLYTGPSTAATQDVFRISCICCCRLTSLRTQMLLRQHWLASDSALIQLMGSTAQSRGKILPGSSAYMYSRPAYCYPEVFGALDEGRWAAAQEADKLGLTSA